MFCTQYRLWIIVLIFSSELLNSFFYQPEHKGTVIVRNRFYFAFQKIITVFTHLFLPFSKSLIQLPIVLLVTLLGAGPSPGWVMLHILLVATVSWLYPCTEGSSCHTGGDLHGCNVGWVLHAVGIQRWGSITHDPKLQHCHPSNCCFPIALVTTASEAEPKTIHRRSSLNLFCPNYSWAGILLEKAVILLAGQPVHVDDTQRSQPSSSVGRQNLEVQGQVEGFVQSED